MPKYTKMIVDKLENIHFATRAIMRYETEGDWYDSGYIEVYEGLSPREKLAVGVHELVEMVLLHLQGVTEDMVNEWDTVDTNGAYNPKMYDKDKRYKEAHEFAEIIEKKIIETARLNWKNYSKKMDDLHIKYEKQKLIPKNKKHSIAYREKTAKRASEYAKTLRRDVKGHFIKPNRIENGKAIYEN